MGNYQIREDTYQVHWWPAVSVPSIFLRLVVWLVRPTGWHLLGHGGDTLLPLTPVRLHALEVIVPFCFSFLFVPYFGPVTRCFTGIDGSLLGTVLYASVPTVICRVVGPQKLRLPFYGPSPIMPFGVRELLLKHTETICTNLSGLRVD